MVAIWLGWVNFLPAFAVNYSPAVTDEITKAENLLSDITKEYEKVSCDINDKTNKLYSEIKRLKNEAELLLKGATNAGLATSFNTKCKESSTELSKALGFYCLSIIFLFVSICPFAWVLYNMSIGKLSIQPWTIFSAVIIVMPGLFLQHFAASRYADTFRILEDYTYKYSIAMGVEGYQKAAPEYADEIAASTFEQIAFNPADNLRGQKQVQVVTHPILELLATKMGLSLIKAKTLSPELLVKIFIDKLIRLAVKNDIPLTEICTIIKDMLGNICSEENSKTNK